MKEKLFAICLIVALVCALILTGCTNEKVETHTENYQKVETLGKIPDILNKVVENNTFKDIYAFDGKLLKVEIGAVDEENRTVTHKVQMMDIYGSELAFYTISSNDAYHIKTLIATEDGGSLFVLGFSDYAYSQGVWASDSGFASRIIKCDKDGNLQFDTPFGGVEGSAFRFCFEKDEKFYLFGTKETSETKGVVSPTDVYMAILDKKGSVLKSQRIAGSDYDSLDSAEYTNNGFLLSISSQSSDGDFTGSNSNGYPVDWVIKVNDNLEITNKARDSGRDYFDTKLGEKEGKAIYSSDNLLKSFDAGTPEAFIDYGDFYLIVSENITGVAEKDQFTNSVLYYTETVYSGYDKNGNLIFRTAVDSTPS